MRRLLEFFSYVALMSHRFHHEIAAQDVQVKRDMKAFTELYSTYQLEYDYYDYKNQMTFTLFIENFEAKAQALEARAAGLPVEGK